MSSLDRPLVPLVCLIVFLGHECTQQHTYAQQLGFQARHGDEIMVCGQFYRIGTPVKLWFDPQGYDAYRTGRRFSAFEVRKWKDIVEDMKAGKVDFVSKPQEVNPDRYGLRYESTAQVWTPEQLEQIRGGGWSLPMLQEKVDQLVLHFDACGTSSQCFYILHDRRGLSVHFLLDADGTIYQTLDLKERAWHATKSNDRSVGIEIAGIGCCEPSLADKTFTQWYSKNDAGRVELKFPSFVRGVDRLTQPLFPRRQEPIRGKIHGREYLQFDFTQQQYDALAKLSAALCDIFPKMSADAPRSTENGTVLSRLLTDDEWKNFSGILGHYHIQLNKSDPGPAMDWEYFLSETRKQLNLLRSN